MRIEQTTYGTVFQRERTFERIALPFVDFPVVDLMCLTYGLTEIYRDSHREVAYFGPRWLARVLSPLLRFRDTAVQSWGLHCYNVGLIHDGDIIPCLPKWGWFRFGWNG